MAQSGETVGRPSRSRIRRLVGVAMRSTLLALVTLVLLAGAAALPAYALLRYDQAVDDHQATVADARVLRDIRAAAVRARAAAQAYILSGDEALAVAYQEEVESFDAVLAALRSTPLPAKAHATIEALGEAFSTWRDEAGDLLVELTREGRTSAARSLAGSGRGDALFARVEDEGQSLATTFEQRTSAARGDLDEARTAALALGAVGLACAVALGGVIIGVVLARRGSRGAGSNAEQRLQTLEQIQGGRDQFLAVASHEIRNPLTGLMLAAELLELEAADAGNEELSRLAGEVASSGRRLATLATELLDFSRVESGRLAIDPQQVPAVDVVDDAVADVQLMRPDAHIDVDGRDPARPVLADPFRLRLVLRNLLQNAVRYAGSPIRVRIEHEDGTLAIHVEDGGPGIPVEERDRIFGRFERGSASQGLEGTGIGLYLARTIVDLHGGSIEVCDSPLGGADFVVRLPVLEPSPPGG